VELFDIGGAVYVVSLKEFEGPLDLLLHMVTSAKIDIKDIFLSQITDQYLEAISQMGDLDMDAASEFIAMAATLIEIKSRALLPKPPAMSEEEESPEEELVRRLTEYKAFKEASEQMAVRQIDMRGYMSRLPEELVEKTVELDIGDLTTRALFEAMQRLLERSQAELGEGEAPRSIRRDVYTVQECMFRIQTALFSKKKVRFTELFEENPARDEVISVFIALLELIKLERVTVVQNQTYGELYLYGKQKRNGKASYGKGGDGDGN
jgi:segregation and condensation protein A